jgi:hypothetical protein
MKAIFKRAVLIFVLAGTVILLTHQFLWRRSFRGEASYDGRPIASARIYTSRHNDVLVVLPVPASAAYVIRRRDNGLGIPMQGFWLKTNLAIGLSDDSIGWIDATAQKRYDPRLQVQESSADFTDFQNHPIHVTW